MAFTEDVYTFIIDSIAKQDTRRILLRFLAGLQQIHNTIGQKMYALADHLSIKTGYKAELLRSLGVPKEITDRLSDTSLQKLIPMILPLYRKKAVKEGFLGFIRTFLNAEVYYDEVYDFWWVEGDKGCADENYAVTATDLKTATLYLKNYMYQTISARLLRTGEGIFRLVIKDDHNHLITPSTILLYEVNPYYLSTCGVSLKVDGVFSDKVLTYEPAPAEEWTQVEFSLGDLCRSGIASSAITGTNETTITADDADVWTSSDIGKTISFGGIDYVIATVPSGNEVTIADEVEETDVLWYINVYMTEVALFDNYEGVNLVSYRNIVLIDLQSGQTTPLFTYKDSYKAIQSYDYYIKYGTEGGGYSDSAFATPIATGDRILFGFEAPIKKFDFTIDTPLTTASMYVKYYDTELETWEPVLTATGEFYLWRTTQDLDVTLPVGATWGKTTIDGVSAHFLCLEVAFYEEPAEVVPAVTSVSSLDGNMDWRVWSGLSASIDSGLVHNVVDFTRPMGTRVEVYNVIQKCDSFSEDTSLYWSPTVTITEENKLQFPASCGNDQCLLSDDTMRLFGIKDTGVSILAEIDDPTAYISITLAKSAVTSYYNLIVDIDNNKIWVYKYDNGVSYVLFNSQYDLRGDRLRIEFVKDAGNLLVSIDGSTVANLECSRASGYWEVLGKGFTLADLVVFQVPSRKEVI